jgi:hypothetical protein
MFAGVKTLYLHPITYIDRPNDALLCPMLNFSIRYLRMSANALKRVRNTHGSADV